ncbi:putative clathrin assembly protein At4g02650 [Zingiber officinale]|uniref:ENTH domain-containing protein n=1 Tax=Zingiber officinale TaxID=94328 RepID=A0A8J5IP51_ZINOF|nr:putative clathrin assembly protein At4g02650 [Zingiber officinale]KAG6539270.1 hypothetical protein ZIOFF_004432 [Zingiber officinale]
MAPSTIKKALGAVKDRTSIGLARVSHSAKLSDLDVAIVKATRHDEHPAADKYLREILNLTCYSRAYVGACVASLSRRLGRTKSWAVALKTLVLVHRLLAEGDPAYEREIFLATHRGTRMLNVSDFRDTSKSESWDFSAFVRTYALYLDERLDYRVQGLRKRRGSRTSFDLEEVEEEEAVEEAAAAADSSKTTPAREMKTEKLFVRTQHLQQLLERFLACRPTGAAKRHRLVVAALFPLVKDSFQIYCDLADIVNIFVDRFMDLEVPTCVHVHDLFSRLARQFDELDCFYGWAKSVGICRSSEYPDIEHITAKKLEVMNEFISDKSALRQRLHEAAAERAALPQAEEPKPAENEDMNQIKALPAPEDFSEEEPATDAMAVVENVTTFTLEEKEADLLNLNDDHAMTVEEHGDKLALALFDGSPAAAAAPKWEAFSIGEDADWESALVTTATNNLSGQRSSLGGGLDMMLLDGLYATGQGHYAAAINHSSKSASSVATTRAPMPALPAPPASGAPADPFAASLAVPPPAYVQMREMEVKQRWLTEEQRVWQRYASEGMQGQAAWSRQFVAYHAPAGSYQYQQNQYQFNGGYGRMA